MASKALTATLRGLLALIIAAAMWEMAARYVGNAALVPNVGTVIGATAQLYTEGFFWKNVWSSLERFLAGYGAAVIIGLPLGLALGRLKPLRLVLGSLVSGLAVTPILTLAPLTALWFGIDSWSQVSLAFVSAVFPLMNRIMSGLAATEPPASPDSPQSLAQSRRADVASCIVAGLRVAILPAVAAVVVAEMIGSVIGLGLMLMNAAGVYHVSGILAVFLVLSLPVIVLVNILRSIEGRLAAARKIG